MTDGLIRSGLSIAWHRVSGFFWSPRVVRTLATVLKVVPTPRVYRVRYKGSYLFATSLDRFVALNLWKYGILERQELSLAEALIRPGMHIVDVGANIGFHSLEFARWTGPSGRVDAFEPAPDNYAVLQRNIKASGLNNITAHELAVSDTVGQSMMYLSPVHRGDHRIIAPGDGRQAIPINTTTLDRLFGDATHRVDLVKIDAQGAEFMVLAGMRDVIRNNPEIIIMLEFCPGLMSKSGHSPGELIALLASLHRRLRVVDHDSREYRDCPIERLTQMASVRRQIDLLLTSH